ncbi:MAG: FAD-dependent oxidoreductase [Bacteroidia bacterium]|nr:FAD-dependent oxidoreductase [Bacteroidia bacterium]
MKKSVVIIGGGVAGMSAAHELIERDFDVKIYERQPYYVGGKARSVDVPNSAKPGYLPLPGEHGFRFFPGFYRHITNTMSRIPLKDQPGKYVADNLVVCSKSIQAQEGHKPVVVPAHAPHNLAELKVSLQGYVNTHDQLSAKEQELMFNKIWQICTSCYDRRMSEYERMSWWDFTEAEGKSDAYQQLFVIGLTRTLVAAQATEISAKTAGDILVQLFQLLTSQKGHADQLLNGPTNEAWLFPWRDYLLSKNVKYNHDHTAVSIDFDKKTNKITGVNFRVGTTGEIVRATGDYYLFAVPVERMYPLVKDNEDLLAAAPVIQQLGPLAKSTRWMTGLQYYLSEEIPLLDQTPGHVIYFDTPWAITTVSQLQFWPHFDIKKHGNGKVRSILSVDISDWDALGQHIKKAAKDCTKEEIKDEVWYQLSLSLNVKGEQILKPQSEILVNWYLDRDIEYMPRPKPEKDKPAFETFNEEPLLVNRVNTWGMRPSASTGVPNFYLSGDYCQCFTDCATMEGANETARRAVNAILLHSKSSFPPCEIWNLHESSDLKIFRYIDRKRFFRGEPWKNQAPWMYKLMNGVMNFLDWIFHIRG